MKTKTIIIIALVVIVLVVGIYLYMNKKKAVTPSISSPIIAVIPTKVQGTQTPEDLMYALTLGLT